MNARSIAKAGCGTLLTMYQASKNLKSDEVICVARPIKKQIDGCSDSQNYVEFRIEATVTQAGGSLCL
jgi:hypothetical protein